MTFTGIKGDSLKPVDVCGDASRHGLLCCPCKGTCSTGRGQAHVLPFPALWFSDGSTNHQPHCYMRGNNLRLRRFLLSGDESAGATVKGRDQKRPEVQTLKIQRPVLSPVICDGRGQPAQGSKASLPAPVRPYIHGTTLSKSLREPLFPGLCN